jgi:transcriptional regulator with XRE-family HTH domain
MYFDAQWFAALLQTKRAGRGLREIADQTGVSISTLSRLEHGEIPDMDSFLALLSWLKLPSSEFIREDEPKQRDTINLIEELLRQDGVLSPHVIDAFVASAQSSTHCTHFTSLMT